MNIRKPIFIITLIILPIILSSQTSPNQSLQNIIRQNNNVLMPTGDQKYITSQDGTIRMFVNVWGQVNRPGTHLVYEDINILNLLSICGGPKEGANLSKIKIIRENPDSTGSNIKILNVENFLEKGSREDLIRLKPYDTVIIPESVPHLLFSNLNLLNTTLHLITLYFQIEYYRRR